MTQKRTLLIRGQPTEVTIENYFQQDIVREIRDMGIYVEEEDITKPNCARITHLCECILYLFSPWLSESIEKEREEMNRIAQHTNTEMGVFNDLLIVFQFFQSLLQDLQYTDFDISDLVTPTPPRLLRMLNAIVNFAKFTDICWSIYEPLAAHLVPIEQTADQLDEMVAELAAAIKEIEIQNRQEEPEVRKLQDMLSDIEHELQEFRIYNESLASDHEKLKKTRQELKDSLESTQFCILEEMELSNHYKRLKDFQVDRVRQLAQEAESNLLQVKRNLAKHEESYSTWTLRCAREKTVLQTLSRVIELLNNINSTKHTFNRSKKTSDSITKELNALDSDLKQLNLQVYYAEREIDQWDIKRKRLDDQQKKKQESMDLFRENARKSDKELEEQTKQFKAETQTLLRECQEIDREIEHLQKSYMISERTLMEHVTRFKLQIKNILPGNMQQL